MTLKEAWKGRKPDEKQKKLDHKREKCIFLCVSDYSKAYKLHNPITKKIVISLDMIFYEKFFGYGKKIMSNNKYKLILNIKGSNP